MASGLMHWTMDDGATALAEDFAEVVADLHALLEGYRMDGGVALPAGERGETLESPPSRSASPRFAVPTPARHDGPPPRAVVARPENLGRTGRFSAPGPAAAPIPPPAVAPRPAAPVGPVAAAPAAGGGLLGRWAAVLADPADELEKLFREAAPFCAGCGAPAPRSAGPLRPRLVVVAAPMSGPAEEMFGKMLVKVLALEPTDVFLLPTPACGNCGALVRRQVEIVKARIVLALGRDSIALTSGVVGGWSRWANADVVTTFHPAEILEDPARRAPAFEHLKTLARRL